MIVRLSHPIKASSAISLIESGIINVFKFLQFAKALEPIVTIVSGNSTLTILEVLENALDSIVVTGFPLISEGTTTLPFLSGLATSVITAIPLSSLNLTLSKTPFCQRTNPVAATPPANNADEVTINAT